MNNTDWYENAVSQAADDAFALMCENPIEGVYLYFRPGEIVASREPIAGFEIAATERVPCNRDRAGVRAWIWERLRRVPCLPPG